MIRKLTFAAALLAATVLTGMANAKTLVYCSEASPAHFDPGPTTGGNDFDASSRTIYNRLVEFEHGRHRHRARPGRKLDSFRRRPGDTPSSCGPA